MEERNEAVNNTVSVIKTIKNVITDIGCVNIISNIVTFVMPPGAGALSKLCMKIGSWCLGAAAADIANEHTDKIIDKAVEHIEEGEPLKILLE